MRALPRPAGFRAPRGAGPCRSAAPPRGAAPPTGGPWVACRAGAGAPRGAGNRAISPRRPAAADRTGLPRPSGGHAVDPAAESGAVAGAAYGARATAPHRKEDAP